MKKVNYSGYDVILRDQETKETLAHSKVLSHNVADNTVELSVRNGKDYDNRHLDLLIHNESDAYCYSGTVQRILINDNIVIGLYHGAEKSERKNERFTLNARANIIEHKDMVNKKLNNENVPVKIIDISRSGVRIECEERGFAIDDCIAVQLPVAGVPRIYYTKIVRQIDIDNPEYKQYGCVLLTKEDFFSKVD